jgi:hypothetical protein
MILEDDNFKYIKFDIDILILILIYWYKIWYLLGESAICREGEVSLIWEPRSVEQWVAVFTLWPYYLLRKKYYYYWIWGPMGSVTGLDVVQTRKISAIMEVTYLWSINSSIGLPWVINNIRNITQRIETNMASPLFIPSVNQSSNIKPEWIIFWSKYWRTKILRLRLCIRDKCSSHPPQYEAN